MKNFPKVFSSGIFSIILAFFSFFSFQSFAFASDEVDQQFDKIVNIAALLTVPYDEKTSITLNPGQLKRGKILFLNTCSVCHTGGVTKTNPNIGLDPDSLKGATPPRNTISAIVNFLNDPKTYDGLDSIAETHPSTKSADIFRKMRTLTQEDLVSIAGYILVEPKIIGEKWGGGKIYY